MKGYDIFGNIMVVKFERSINLSERKRVAKQLLKSIRSVKTVLEKTAKFSGRLRLQKTRYLAGEKTKEVLYKENGCEFRFNIDSCYFSPRLSNERREIAEMVGEGERVLVMCGGVAPFAVVIAKLSEADEVVSVELSRECNKYALENVKRNKLQDIVEIIQGNVRKKVPLMKDKFDRIILTRPNLKDSFLDLAFGKIKKGGKIHYYGFYEESNIAELKELINSEAKKAKKKIRILRIKKAGDIGVKKFRYRVDFVVK